MADPGEQTAKTWPDSYGPDDHLVCPRCGAQDSVVVSVRALVRQKLGIVGGEVEDLPGDVVEHMDDETGGYRCSECGYLADPTDHFAPGPIHEAVKASAQRADGGDS